MKSARLIIACLIVSSTLFACKKKQEATFYESNRKESVEAPVKEVPQDILGTQQAFVNLRSGRPSRLPPPAGDYLSRIGPEARALLDQILSCAAIGSPETVSRQLQAFIDRTGADELMITSQIFDHAARLRSYQITAEVHDAN